jgi:membrane protein DedA with SNARE-associated domain/rhodanese-related sulfurtransferase
MALSEHFLLLYGYLVLFAWVLAGQLGIPLPATPVLLTVGALTAEHDLRLPLALLTGLGATLLADTAWFIFGRRYGNRVLHLLCKLSLEPNVCISRTRDSFRGRRSAGLIIAKFIPGVAILAPPTAGQSGMSYGRFLLFDGLGATFWLASTLIAGRFFGDILNHDPSLLNLAGRFSGSLLLLGILGFFAARIVRRRALGRKLVSSRLEPEELKRQIDAGENVYIVDLRHPLELIPDPYTLPGAHVIPPDSIAKRNHEIPRDRDVVLYCTCPSEATAAATAMALYKLGIERVRPLRGGFDEWKRLGFPLDAVKPEIPAAE